MIRNSILIFLLLVSSAPTHACDGAKHATTSKLSTVSKRAPAAQACEADSDCGPNLQSTESCRLMGTGTQVCNGKQAVNIRCENSRCTRYLGQCGDCEWVTLPALPDQCAVNDDCSKGMAAEEACSVILATNQKCEGKAQVTYQCAPRTSGQKKCDKLVGPCQGC